MVWLDIVVLICLGFGLIKGLFDGLVRQLIAVVALFLAFVFSGAAAGYIRNFAVETMHWTAINDSPVVGPVCYIIAFVLIVAVLSLLGHLLDKIISVTPIVVLNKLGGAVFGLVLWLLCLSFALNTVEAFDRDSDLISQDVKNQSFTYFPVKIALPTIYPHLHEVFMAD
jgi:membrane protein required for colicin V production